MLDQQYIAEAYGLFEEKARLEKALGITRDIAWMSGEVRGTAPGGMLYQDSKEHLLAVLTPADFVRLPELRLEEIAQRRQEKGVRT